MPPPFKCRRVRSDPQCNYFKPRGVPMGDLEETTLALDEFEALRLADLEGLYQEQAADKMKISRQTFGNILGSAHRKIAESIVHGKAIKIEGGVCNMIGKRSFQCSECDHMWALSYGTGRPGQCPECGSSDIHRASSDRGHARGGRGCGRRNRGRGRERW
jgi:predicted DNA-binding protein (UPF0251 family)